MSDPTSALIRALRGGFSNFTVEQAESRSWASGTFVGTRHKLIFRTEGDEADASADTFLADLTEAEFTLRGHILADIALISDARSEGEAGPLARISLEALTVEDA
ncbi:MAG: hypothetical protein H0W74_06515 [Sphingosinicella sp.]|nr:hypothetical protein [Sphingosinicella sp.]